MTTLPESTQERTEMLIRAINLKWVDGRLVSNDGDTWKFEALWEDGDHPTTMPDLYGLANMQMAWPVSNWVYARCKDRTVDLNEVNSIYKTDLMWWLYKGALEEDPEGYQFGESLQSHLDALVDWLDEVLELAIGGGLLQPEEAQ